MTKSPSCGVDTNYLQRRLRSVYLDRQAAVFLVRLPMTLKRLVGKSPQRLEIAEPVLDVPDDAYIESVAYDAARDGWLLLVSSAQFSPVPEGAIIPVISNGGMTKRVVQVVL